MNKNRKGIVFGMMKLEEQRELKRAVEDGLQCIYYHYARGFEDISDPSFSKDIAYWIREWDNPTGKELIGKWCIVWSSLEDDYMVAKIYDYSEVGYYITNTDILKHAEILPNEMQIKLDKILNKLKQIEEKKNA